MGVWVQHQLPKLQSCSSPTQGGKAPGLLMQHLQAYLQCAPSSFCIHRDTLEVREEAAFTLQPKSAGFSTVGRGLLQPSVPEGGLLVSAATLHPSTWALNPQNTTRDASD